MVRTVAVRRRVENLAMKVFVFTTFVISQLHGTASHLNYARTDFARALARASPHTAVILDDDLESGSRNEADLRNDRQDVLIVLCALSHLD
jgi:hypothetical protein